MEDHKEENSADDDPFIEPDLVSIPTKLLGKIVTSNSEPIHLIDWIEKSDDFG